MNQNRTFQPSVNRSQSVDGHHSFIFYLFCRALAFEFMETLLIPQNCASGIERIKRIVPATLAKELSKSNPQTAGMPRAFLQMAMHRFGDLIGYLSTVGGVHQDVLMEYY
jgi:hypothetical protein